MASARHLLLTLGSIWLVLSGTPLPGLALDSTSASFRLRFAHPSAIGPARLSGSVPGPGIGSSGVSLGQAEAIGPGGSGGSLASHFPGFWPLLAGGVPSLDSDGDGLSHFLDDDDDGDGLLDVVETDTGSFVSAGDTGTNRLLADTDGDGFDDGVEVGAGTDPNDAGSFPVPAIPALPLGLWPVLFFGVALAGWRSRS